MSETMHSNIENETNPEQCAVNEFNVIFDEISKNNEFQDTGTMTIMHDNEKIIISTNENDAKYIVITKFDKVSHEETGDPDMKYPAPSFIKKSELYIELNDQNTMKYNVLDYTYINEVKNDSAKLFGNINIDTISVNNLKDKMTGILLKAEKNVYNVPKNYVHGTGPDGDTDNDLSRSYDTTQDKIQNINFSNFDSALKKYKTIGDDRNLNTALSELESQFNTIIKGMPPIGADDFGTSLDTSNNADAEEMIHSVKERVQEYKIQGQQRENTYKKRIRDNAKRDIQDYGSIDNELDQALEDIA